MAGVVICDKVKNCVNDRGRYHFGINWEADEDGQVPVTATPAVDGYITLVNIVPGTPAPTDKYDIALEDNCGVDLMGGILHDLSSLNPSQFRPDVSGEKGNRVVQGQITFKLTGNVAPGAKGKCIIFIQE